MDSHELYKELKEVNASIGEIKIILARNSENLEYHIRRTDLLEKKLDLMEGDVLRLRGFFSIGGWILGIAATVITLIAKLTNLLK